MLGSVPQAPNNDGFFPLENEQLAMAWGDAQDLFVLHTFCYLLVKLCGDRDCSYPQSARKK